MSSWSGFHRLEHAERLKRIAAHAGLTAEQARVLAAPSALAQEQAEAFIENATGSFPIPLGFAVGFSIDGKDTVVPMAVEESSVIAAASHGAKLAGDIKTASMPPVTIGQIEIRDVPGAENAKHLVADEAGAWRRDLDARIPRMIDRGGGVRAIEGRFVGEGRVVVHIHVDTRDAMGANLVNSLCEYLGPRAAKSLGGRLGLRILTNHATARIVTARCRIPLDRIGGRDIAQAIVEADRFAFLDPYRAATHNKGVMNGIDPVALATGNDWRAVEAGAHAWAARTGRYQGLTRYRIEGDELLGRLELPISVGTVGGVTRLHPVAQACMAVLGDPDARRLGRIMAAVGLAQNLAALRALSADGIQAGHMALHARNVAMQAGASPKEAPGIAERMVAEGNVSLDHARRIRSGNGP